ncbi:MAG: tryptophan--tRNA ligase [Candidatus Magasanikbacteria bacterium]
MPNNKPKLISGIRPTGKLHLGNYLGALKQFVELQDSNEYECLFFIADYHSLAGGFESSKNREQIIDTTASYMAAGLSPKKSTIFIQSSIQEHTNLAWILSSLASFGKLKRMTQFKEKSKQKDNVDVGLFYYPVLMSADILLYDAKKVPVGEDQTQHLELTRDLARKFNNRFSDTFEVPEPVMTEAPRIKDLQNPENKMSKSSPKGCLFIDDSPKVIKDKIMSALTDSGNNIIFDPENKPGISNLILIYSSLADLSREKIKDEFQDSGYGDFKKSLSKLIIDYFEDYRNKKENLMKDKERTEKTLRAGNKKARKIAAKKMTEVKQKIGIEVIK